MSQEPTHRLAGRILTPDAEAYRAAADLLQAGEVVAFPTETVYGLGADATNDRAVARIFETKGRPSFNPLIVHFETLEAAAREVEINPWAEALAEAFWPGPLTLVLPRKADSRISLLCSAGLPSLAVRVPRHEIGQNLLHAVQRPLAAPSANASGRISPTSAIHVAASLGERVPLILDGGACEVGLESTVIDLSGPRPVILRPGGITRAQLEAVLGTVDEATADSDIKSPGMMTSHYAPSLPIRLGATSVNANEALLAFGPKPLEGAAVTVNLSASGDLTEAAASLFNHLHRLDREKLAGIAVMPVPEQGLGIAINDRLARAAAPRH
ncbi:L-threonylcarbamoyladenylate synthase [Denitrobaculum tricleocarpae]|uniref:Threonylcarbamoyl-AMP synthase n=1 Tax=Denitrobaculum tricleocarpae TaxID=2591009 RepID=A0A545U345_9PROT|nr:L-threonylcarbamoyladenylate synthase [Denitrobaculum tricleocarpae]TQV83886.1 threonylcarbamoyl-AMP synthase [Denitrobaculum tricleocarpae]